MPSGGFVKTVVVFGYAADIFAVDGEGLVATIEELPHITAYGDTLADVIYNLEIELEVETEMDAIWNERGTPVEESEDENED